LREDPYERHDLSERYPKRVAELKERMRRFVDELGPLPEAKLVNFPPDRAGR
jgi:hypothetical protein